MNELDLAEQERRETFAVGLDELAAAVRANPKFPIPAYLPLTLTVDANVWGWREPGQEEVSAYHVSGAEYVVDPKASLTKLRSLIKSLGGRRKDKSYTDSGFACVRKFGPHVVVKVSASREAVCRRVPTGNKIVHAAVTYPERVEEEFEWVCDETLLGPKLVEAGA
jgi:hypothetical protein